MSDALNPAVPTKPSAASATEGDASSTGIAATIERLRRHRVRRPRHSEHGHVLTAIRREASRQQKRRGGLDEVWEEILRTPRGKGVGPDALPDEFMRASGGDYAKAPGALGHKAA